MPQPFSPGFSSGFGAGIRAYRFLMDHWIGGYYILAGEIVTDSDGNRLPYNWVPTPNVDPLTTEAVDKFYAVGPVDQGLARTHWTPIPVVSPVTYWRLLYTGSGFSGGFDSGFRLPVNLWVLTGLGADQTKYPPVSRVVDHPVWSVGEF